MANVPTQAMWAHAKDGRQDWPPNPRSAARSMNKKNYRRFAFRTHAAEIAEWNRVAQAQKKPLSVFLRQAAHAAKAGISSDELNAHLIQMRSILNTAMQVRTPEQKNQRIQIVRDHLTLMLHRKG